MLSLTPFLHTYCTVLLFVFGAVFASFLGCMGWRMCKGESVLYGRSHCDSCGHVLSARDLIPIISYLWNKGRCRYCGAAIPKMNFYGEMLMAGAFVLAFWRYNMTYALLLMLFFICILYLVSVTDICEQKIPDSVLLVAVIVRVVFCVFNYVFDWNMVMYLQGVVLIEKPPLWRELLGLLVDGLAVSLPLLLLVLLMEKLWKKEAMGGGDIKLLFVTGLYLGWEQNLLAVFLACIIGIVVGMVQQRKAEKEAVDEEVASVYFPFGPSIAAGAVLAMIFGNAILNWYLSLFY